MTIRAARYASTGGPEVLEVDEIDEVEPAPERVVVRVRAAGLNPYDAKVRSGAIPSTSPFPRRIGGDLAGTVVRVGVGAQYWDGSPIAVGDEVLGRAAGALADQVSAAASDLARRPADLDVEVAGGLHVAGLTAVSVLATVPVTDADTVLVGGAAGAVGLITAQLARAQGARVIGTASPRNHVLLASLGIEPVAYGRDLASRLGTFGTITAVYDCHGRDALDAGVALGVAPERMVAIAAGDALAETGAQNVERAARTAENLEHLAARVAAGEIVLPVAEVFALDDVAAAFAALEASHAPGKIIVVP